MYKYTEFRVATLYIYSLVGDVPATAVIKREVYLVKELKVKILIGSDIIGLEYISIDY